MNCGMTLSVGVIGLGALGEPIAGLLLKAGFATSVYDVRRDPLERLAKLGGRPCASAAEVARHSEVIVSLVLDEPQTMDVVCGKSGVVIGMTGDLERHEVLKRGPRGLRDPIDRLQACAAGPSWCRSLRGSRAAGRESSRWISKPSRSTPRAASR